MNDRGVAALVLRKIHVSLSYEASETKQHARSLILACSLAEDVHLVEIKHHVRPKYLIRCCKKCWRTGDSQSAKQTQFYLSAIGNVLLPTLLTEATA